MKKICIIFSIIYSHLVMANWVKYENENLYIPKVSKNYQGIVLWLHGCTQEAKSFTHFSNMVEAAEKYHLIVFAPDQSRLKNPLKCWNWFLAKNNKRNEGELKEITNSILKLKNTYLKANGKILVGGFSAGGVLTSSFAICYPDIFDGALIHSGGPNQLLQFPSKRSSCYLGTSENIKLKYVMIVHGENDHIAPFELAEETAEDFKKFFDDNQLDSIVNFIPIKDKAHIWSGSKAGSIFSSPDTFDATDMFLDNFFSKK